MSFRLFIYYCALCGGWAALLAWGLAYFAGLTAGDVDNLASSALIAGVLGLFLAAAVGLLDALLNAVGFVRLVRVLVCLVVGFLGGLCGGFVGELLYGKLGVPRAFGWMLVGTIIGASVGVFDLLRALVTLSGFGQAIRKTVNGIIGGVLGGMVGGLLFGLLIGQMNLPRSPLAVGLVVLGVCIGLLIGLAQVILKEAWVKVERGFRAGRELMLSKAEITIGRAEACDIGLFGDPGVERQHARILLKGNRYLLADAGTPGGTFLNDQRISGPTPLRSGDVIRVGKNVLRFGEKAKRK